LVQYQPKSVTYYLNGPQLSKFCITFLNRSVKSLPGTVISPSRVVKSLGSERHQPLVQGLGSVAELAVVCVAQAQNGVLQVAQVIEGQVLLAELVVKGSGVFYE